MGVRDGGAQAVRGLGVSGRALKGFRVAIVAIGLNGFTVKGFSVYLQFPLWLAAIRLYDADPFQLKGEEQLQ